MKKRVISLLASSFLLIMVMNNCQDHETPFPLTPDAGTLAEIDAIDLAPVTLVQPAAVPTTPSSIASSAKTTEQNNALNNLSSGTASPVLQQNANLLTAALTSTEVDALAGITPQAISDIAAGGAVPANIQAILDKVAATPALQAFLPVFTLPTVGGTTVSGGREGVLEGIEKSEGIEVEDACIQRANEKYTEKKDKLDEKYTTQTASADATYNAAIAPLAAEEASCKSGIPARYNALRLDAQATAVQSLARIDAAGFLPPALATALKALVKAGTLQYIVTLNQLQVADTNACSNTTLAKTAAAATARNTNKAAQKNSYDEAIVKLDEKRVKAIQSCHNQGGGR